MGECSNSPILPPPILPLSHSPIDKRLYDPPVPRPAAPSWLTRLAVAAPVVLFLGVYLPAAGRGFIQDDYVWVLHSRARSLGISGRCSTRTTASIGRSSP
jgi:hypothetical protein